MDEINQAEQTADQQDAFLEGWEESTPAAEDVTANRPDGTEAQEEAQPEAEEESAEDGESAEESEKEPAAADTQQETAKETAEASDPQTWSIKHLGEQKTITAADITPELLQKGMDYDRIRAKYEEAKPALEFLSESAKNAEMSIPEYVKYLRVQVKKNAGMSDEEASRLVDIEDREAAVSQKEAANQESQDAAKQAKYRVEADIAEFAKAFPEVYETAKDDPKTIPQSVWDAVNAGSLSLTSAYAKYAVEQANQLAKEARDMADTAKKNQQNANRSTGSMQSAGNDKRNSDAFLEGWES